MFEPVRPLARLLDLGLEPLVERSQVLGGDGRLQGGRGGLDRGHAAGQQDPVGRRRDEVTAHTDPAGDRVEGGQQDDERDVLVRHVEERPRLADEVEREHRQPERDRDDEFVAIRLPPVRRREGKDRDGEEHDPEREHGVDGQQGGGRHGLASPGRGCRRT